MRGCLICGNERKPGSRYYCERCIRTRAHLCEQCEENIIAPGKTRCEDCTARDADINRENAARIW